MDTVNSVKTKEAVSQLKAREELQERLVYLNKLTHNEIAEYFFAYGVKGSRFQVVHCPLANWIRSELIWADIVITSSKQISAYPDGGLVESNRLDSSVSLTPYENVRVFVE